MLKNRDRLADDIKKKLLLKGNNINKYDILDVLYALEDVLEESLSKGYDVKIGSLVRLSNQKVTNRKRYDGLNKKYFLSSANKIVVKKLKRLTDLEAKK
ncbi:HU family DNA-binding protein [Streptomyces sp. TRM76323]|uniref:HU family DNA-binding protein n=1 Tax=Streptomyces tamarix TaxID=3078565 RepID=A0ABU3QLT0_9ACTN|nr:HU family DNA-binding protein [Streptomyces tamarix]MDT9683413.1 HU family DNA-binding protein [Streptomyces tamarix]